MEGGTISPGFGPPFIQEEGVAAAERILSEQRERGAAARSGLAFEGPPPDPLASMEPYLQEMDELLNGCEELVGRPFGSRFSASRGETRADASEGCGETSASLRGRLYASYADGPGRGVTSAAMPLTSAGNRLSETMVEYEGQLLGMLAMLESSMGGESGMDFEPQGREYAHVRENPRLRRGTTQGSATTSETRATHPGSWGGPGAGGGGASGETGSEATPGDLPMNGGRQTRGLLGGDVDGFSGVLDPRSGFSGPSTPFDCAGDDPMCCEATEAGSGRATAREGDASGIEVDDGGGEELKMDTADLESGANDLGALGCQMEACIEEVQRLERRRKELLTEVLELRGAKDRGEAVEEEEEEPIDGKVVKLMNAFKREEEGRRAERTREIQSLREERAEEERTLWKVSLERQELHGELRTLRRRLFAAARDCAHNQAALNTQRREVEQLRGEEEKLQALVLQLTEEGSRLRAARQRQLSDLQAALQAQTCGQTSNAQDQLSECRRHSYGDVQQYLQAGLKALEDRYEPILLTLIKRREATAAALLKAREHARDLRAQLRPLKEEIQQLTLQRACLDDRLKLIAFQWREDVGQCKVSETWKEKAAERRRSGPVAERRAHAAPSSQETVSFLEDSGRVLQTELRIQKRNTREMEELRDGLNKQLLLYRAAIEEHNKSDDDEEEEEDTIECS
ncbi:uncharacterized protein sync isoform X3 [Pseudoliparis swirei]|nr:uncharacterized protein sync isoform X3 [Pseudoliparis swirei]